VQAKAESAELTNNFYAGDLRCHSENPGNIHGTDIRF
jgi:hypothetical protein